MVAADIETEDTQGWKPGKTRRPFVFGPSTRSAGGGPWNATSAVGGSAVPRPRKCEERSSSAEKMWEAVSPWRERGAVAPYLEI